MLRAFGGYRDRNPTGEAAMADDESQSSKRGEDAREEDDDSQGRDFDKEVDEAKEEVKRLEEDPPEKLEDWPTGQAKYETFGGPEHETSYEEAATSKLGPSDVRHYEDGAVTVGGEEADDPEEYKGEPIPGGPTDPNAPKLSGEKDLTEGSDDSASGDEDGDEERDEDADRNEDADRDEGEER
jgi:hypothetical protein